MDNCPHPMANIIFNRYSDAIFPLITAVGVVARLGTISLFVRSVKKSQNMWKISWMSRRNRGNCVIPPANVLAGNEYHLIQRERNDGHTKDATATKKAASKPAKTPTTTATHTPTAPTKMSQIQAAIAVLKKARKPMSCKAMVEAMEAQKLWSSPGGKTPHATLYASILRDISRGDEARFAKVDRGQFTLAGK